jgi:hypothetical protein
LLPGFLFFPQHLRIAQGKGNPYLSTYTPERTKLGVSVERKTNASYSSIGIVFIEVYIRSTSARLEALCSEGRIDQRNYPTKSGFDVL